MQIGLVLANSSCKHVFVWCSVCWLVKGVGGWGGIWDCGYVYLCERYCTDWGELWVPWNPWSNSVWYLIVNAYNLILFIKMKHFDISSSLTFPHLEHADHKLCATNDQRLYTNTVIGNDKLLLSFGLVKTIILIWHSILCGFYLPQPVSAPLGTERSL